MLLGFKVMNANNINVLYSHLITYSKLLKEVMIHENFLQMSSYFKI